MKLVILTLLFIVNLYLLMITTSYIVGFWFYRGWMEAKRQQLNK